jgi:molecular chaperone HscB
MDPFATLGIARRYELDEAELEARYRDLQREFHPDRHVQAPASARRSTLQKAVEINEAYRTLRDPQRRAECLLALLGGNAAAAASPDRSADPELLMEMMELREELSEAKAARDVAKVAALAGNVERAQREATRELARLFDQLSGEPAPSALLPVQQLVSRLKYYQRFLDEVAVFEDEAHP